MRYVYYIIAIVIAFSGLVAYGLFDTRVKISKPYISVNDRIISEEEFSRMLKRKPAYMTREQFAESIIDKQLLIQEAIKLKINKEESFRQSVENFYEQSLIKILLDRKLDKLVVDVTDEELDAYENLLTQKVFITKIRFKTFEDAETGSSGVLESFEADFTDLSDDLKFIILTMGQDKLSDPRPEAVGYVVYRLDRTEEKQGAASDRSFDMKKVSVFLQDKKKEKQLESWIRSIRESADIWREK
jgi:hypothetical protein